VLSNQAHAQELKQIDFTPDIPPLILPTLTPQPFGNEIHEQPDQSSIDLGEAEGLLLQELPDDGDPLDWIEFIEQQWENVDVIACSDGEFVADCTQWTTRELKLLLETLEDYLFKDYIDRELLFIRTEDADWSGLMEPRRQDGEHAASIWIADSAWRSPPAHSAVDIFDYLFRKDTHFQSTIAHELTHAATWFHPTLHFWWHDAKGAFEEAYGVPLDKGDWRLGFFYDWSVYDEYRDDEVLYQQLIDGELFAMTVASIMYDPWWNQGTK
jgi:hypothetical protein